MASQETGGGGLTLCLSGGGYRAMVFHLGALWRLNEAGWLPRLELISAVSGGAIPATLLGLRWERLAFDGDGRATNLTSQVVEPIRELSNHSVDTAAAIEGVFNPGAISERLVDRYQRDLFGDKTLRDLPENPRVVLAASSVQTGELWHFSRDSLREPRVGEVRIPVVSLGRAVAASAAVPPFFSPVHVELDTEDFEDEGAGDLRRDPYTTDIVLTNGGFLDKLALAAAKSSTGPILVADGGASFREEPEPRDDWRHHSHRILELLDHQERERRKRDVLEAFTSGKRTGAYWGLQSDITDFELGDAIDCPVEKTRELSAGSLRLKRLPRRLQERLINWGFAVCDAAIRKHVDPELAAPSKLPYPNAGVG